MKGLILFSLIGLAAAQVQIQIPRDTFDQAQQLWQQWQQPQQQQPWDNSVPQWQQPQQPQQPNWQDRPWNNQVVRVPPQPEVIDPWMIRPEARCPDVGESYHWALIVPSWRDQQALSLCLGGVASNF